MSSIRAECPECGDVKITAADLVLRVCADNGRCSYAYRCPECRVCVARECSRRMADVLLGCGVRLDRWRLPAELFEPHPTGPVFVADDLLDFHELLESSGTIGAWVQAIKEKRG